MLPPRLSLDPPTLPPSIASTGARLQALIETWGWPVLIVCILGWIIHRTWIRLLLDERRKEAVRMAAIASASQSSSASSVPLHLSDEDRLERMRAARLAQQAALSSRAPGASNASSSSSPSSTPSSTSTHNINSRITQSQPHPPAPHKPTPTLSERDKRLARKYGHDEAHPPEDGTQHESMTFQEVFGDSMEGFYQGRPKKRRPHSLANTTNSSSSSSSSSSHTSGFRPYRKPDIGGGGGARRFGGGGPRRGG